MSILIEGMDLPKAGFVKTITLFCNGDICDKDGMPIKGIKAIQLPAPQRTIAIAEKIDFNNLTKAKEMPSKHGRLIDADKLMEKVREEADFPSHEWCKAIECLEDAPTVIEASV